MAQPETTAAENGNILTGSRDERSVLDFRAALLAEPLPEEPLASEILELLTFTLNSEWLAIETRFVREVLYDVEVTALPGQNGPLTGITNLRGEVLAVMSLSGLLNNPKVESNKDRPNGGHRVIVLGIEQAQFGIYVSDVIEVTGIPNNEVLDPSRQTRISENTLVRGVTKDACVILDGRSVLADQRFIIEDKD